MKCEGMESRNEALGTENSKPAFFWRREREGLGSLLRKRIWAVRVWGGLGRGSIRSELGHKF